MTRQEGVRARPIGRHRKAPAWIGDVVAAVFIVGSAFTPFSAAHLAPGGLLTVALVAAPALVLPFRRRWPSPVLAVCVAVYVLALFTGQIWPGIILALIIAMFGVATRSTRRTTVITAAAAIVIILVSNIIAAGGDILEVRLFSVEVTVAFAAAAGDAARSRREYILAIMERAERAEQTRDAEARRRVSEERLRIARDLHDALAHQIAVISLNAGVASSAIASRPERAEEAVRTIQRAARTVLTEIGALLDVLRTDDDEADGTLSPQPGLDRLDDLLGRFADAGLAATVRVEGDPSRVGEATSLAAYRVLQEALTNAHKHGAEHRAHVLVRVADDALTLVVTNPVGPRPEGRGPVADAAGSGLGLVGLRERVAAVRGTVETGPVPEGWRVSATLPIAKEIRS